MLPAGTRFEINNFHNDPEIPDLWWAELSVTRDEVIGSDIEVAHWVTARVRILAAETDSIETLREKIFQTAVDELQHAAKLLEGKSARDLIGKKIAAL